MEKLSKKELENLAASQKEQLTRYETRLKDVVTAYKGLLKEKEALDSSLSAITKAKDETAHHAESTRKDAQTSEDAQKPETEHSNLQVQIATLMNSLATLSAEKSRMEASFQADKKQLRQENLIKDRIIKDLNEKLKHSVSQSCIDVETFKSKLIVERHDRDKEHNDHMVMVRELQKLLSDERHLKENLEMQLNDLKTQFSQTNLADRTIKELSQELDSSKKKLKQMEGSNVDQENASSILHQLQSEMTNLKQQHAVAIKNEQARAISAEEGNKKLAAIHEERVANLESRLAELSNTVGTYDRLRQQDQESIYKLKDKLAQMNTNENQNSDRKFEAKMSLNTIIDDILHLKKLLITENNKLERPIDISKIFATHTTNATNVANNSNQTIGIEAYMKLEEQFGKCCNENESLKHSLEIQNSHIKTLQDKIKVLNRNIDEFEVEYKNKLIEHHEILKVEKTKYREIISSMELDFRSKISQLEQQLQKQRDRSLLLLEEKENEIKTLKTSFEIFMPGNQSHSSRDEGNERDDDEEAEHHKKKLNHLSSVLNPNSQSAGSGVAESYHMLHYAHELARKDVEISGLRKSRHAAETALRQALQDKVTAQEELHDKIQNLEEHVDRLERCKSREGANLEYLKNVILSFLVSTDADGKRHMLNAIGAVLQFSPTEMNSITNYFNHKK